MRDNLFATFATFAAIARRDTALAGRAAGRGAAVALVVALVAALASVAACDAPLGDDPAIDPDAPVVRILSPERGAYLGDVSSVTVTGTVEDESALRSLTINGLAAAVDRDGGFSITLPVSPTGTTLLTAEAIDSDGNLGRQTHAISAGPRVALNGRVKDAVTAAISDTAFAAVGNVAAGLVANSDLGAWIAPYNPVISKGAPDGPDCLYGTVAVGALDVSAASISLLPGVSGLELVAELSGVTVPMHLNYAALCIDGSRNVAMSATKVRIAGRFTIGIKNGAFEIKLVQPQVTFEGFRLDLGGIPGSVVNLLDLNKSLGAVLAWAVEKLAVPLLSDALAGFDGTTSAAVLGKTLDVVVAPAEITMSPADARVRLDTQFHVHGDEAGPGYVYVPNLRPSMDPSRGFQLAVADDAANQLLASFWAAHGMDQRIDLTTGDYGGLGKLYDRVEIEGKLPLSVRAGAASLEIVIPDVMVTFRNGDAIATQIAVNGVIALAVEQGGDGALRLTTGTPQVFVDIVRDGVDGANPLASSQFEALTSFALARLGNVAASLVGAIPLPSGGGASLRGVQLSGATGYLIVDGRVE
jgi:Glucodextranase, domain B